MNNQQPKPKLFNEKTECCGCTACESVCSQAAIAMIADEQGFKYPVIDEEKCIGCGMCMEVCPLK